MLGICFPFGSRIRAHGAQQQIDRRGDHDPGQPARYYLVVLRGVVLKGATLEPYLDQMVFLSIFAVAVMSVAWLRLLRQEA